MQKMALAWRREGVAIGFVPTMGFLHEGHVSLMHRARKAVGRKGVVVVSIFVNPTQFAPTEDLAKYPRDLERDKRLCREAGVDVIFNPGADDIYGDAFSTYVIEEGVSMGMEGASRPTHFRGVATVVAKLFNIVLPDVAVFGAKDWQQAAVVRRMVRDLNFPLKLIVAPTIRERDGLAMSSRNKYLNAEERQQATVLHRSIQMARGAVKKKGASAAELKRAVAELVAREAAARLDYVEFFHPETLEVTERVAAGTQMALAVFVGKTRLIDNARL